MKILKSISLFIFTVAMQATIAQAVESTKSENILKANDGGGQFQYYTAQVRKKITDARDTLVGQIATARADLLLSMFQANPVDKVKLISILHNLKFSPQIKNVYTKNPDGDLDLRSLRAVTIGGQPGVEVLGPFFDDVRNNNVIASIEANLLHEALHYFGYDQDQAWTVATGWQFPFLRKPEEWSRCREILEASSGFCIPRQYNDAADTDYLRVVNEVISWLTTDRALPYRAVYLASSSKKHIFYVGTTNPRRVTVKLASGKPQEKVINMPCEGNYQAIGHFYNASCSGSHMNYDGLQLNHHELRYWERDWNSRVERTVYNLIVVTN